MWIHLGRNSYMYAHQGLAMLTWDSELGRNWDLKQKHNFVTCLLPLWCQTRTIAYGTPPCVDTSGKKLIYVCTPELLSTTNFHRQLTWDSEERLTLDPATCVIIISNCTLFHHDATVLCRVVDTETWSDTNCSKWHNALHRRGKSEAGIRSRTSLQKIPAIWLLSNSALQMV